ncbi:MAG: hypothetical protein COA58_08440 [Bacteroidetes bacterium]|nr:MAG: hypothetical protein COA58_08440 [Bacteroidota bacterium]
MIDFEKIQASVDSILDMMSALTNERNATPPNSEQSDAIFTVDQLAEFLDLSKPSIYAKISNGELPVIKKQKRCYFFKADIIDYLRKDRVKPNYEIEEQVSQIIKGKS